MGRRESSDCGRVILASNFKDYDCRLDQCNKREMILIRIHAPLDKQLGCAFTGTNCRPSRLTRSCFDYLFMMRLTRGGVELNIEGHSNRSGIHRVDTREFLQANVRIGASAESYVNTLKSSSQDEI
jgi:hypothetical protein